MKNIVRWVIISVNKGESQGGGGGVMRAGAVIRLLAAYQIGMDIRALKYLFFSFD